MPSTRPRASSSGPPELPGLIAASVWIASPIPKRVSDSMLRSTAEITPTESDWRSPNGLPMAATGSPTVMLAELPRRSGVSDRPAGSTFSSATSAFRSSPTISRRHAVAVGELDVHLLGALVVRRLALVTTWAFVAT